MPSASDELRELMNQRFGDPIDDSGPSRFLTDAGYEELASGQWIAKPGVFDLNDMTRDEFDCLLFLVHEWDHSGELVFAKNSKGGGA